MNTPQDFEYQLACDIRASFLWTPYPANLTAAVRGWVAAARRPDVVVMGHGLWPILHSGDAAMFESSLRRLSPEVSVDACEGRRGGESPSCSFGHRLQHTSVAQLSAAGG